MANPVSQFSLLVQNLNTVDHPIYRAYCVNGYGSGYGNSIDEAARCAVKQIANLVHICNQINMSLDLIGKEDYMAKTNAIDHGFTSWEDSEAHWVEIDVVDITREL